MQLCIQYSDLGLGFVSLGVWPWGASGEELERTKAVGVGVGGGEEVQLQSGNSVLGY